MASYAAVASEYYDEILHPTCADFRAAASVFLKNFFLQRKPSGRIADVGAGKSLVAEFFADDLVLIDYSIEMLAKNAKGLERRILDIEVEPFGSEEFDWVFAILGDPYNSLPAWRNIFRSLKYGGRCVFVVPSWIWAQEFRKSSPSEKDGLARFDLNNGQTLYLPSSINSRETQRLLMKSAGFKVEELTSVSVNQLTTVRSDKIKKFLRSSDAIVDIYVATKPFG